MTNLPRMLSVSSMCLLIINTQDKKTIVALLQSTLVNLPPPAHRQKAPVGHSDTRSQLMHSQTHR